MHYSTTADVLAADEMPSGRGVGISWPIKQGVEVEGFVADVRPAYGRAGMVIAPLLASAGTNVKILEAMAMGKAVVSTPGGVNGLDLVDGRDVVGAGTGLGEAPATIWGCPGAGANSGLVGAVAGAEAVCGEVAGRSSILTIPVVRPTLATSIAATLSQGADSARPRSRLRLGRAMTSAAQSSSAVAKSNSCRVLKFTIGPDSAALKEPKNKLWASKPRGSKRGGTGR